MDLLSIFKQQGQLPPNNIRTHVTSTVAKNDLLENTNHKAKLKVKISQKIYTLFVCKQRIHPTENGGGRRSRGACFLMCERVARAIPRDSCKYDSRPTTVRLADHFDIITLKYSIIILFRNKDLKIFLFFFLAFFFLLKYIYIYIYTYDYFCLAPQSRFPSGRFLWRETWHERENSFFSDGRGQDRCRTTQRKCHVIVLFIALEKVRSP